MNINKNNYEAFFLDYHEGNLSPQQVADLLLFVEQHPELREEFESFENVTLDDLSTISFDQKSSLKKEITLENREEYFIRSIENTLTPAEKNLLDAFIKQHPQFLKELELFQKTRVPADTTIVFENKEALQKSTADDLLIASMEGLLTKQENIFLNQQLAVDAEMQHNYSLYKQTKLVADTTIVFENKEELKREERKIIPFYFYVAAAASIALLIGMFFLYNSTTQEQTFADKTNETKTAPVENNNSTAVIKNIQPIENNPSIKNQMAATTSSIIKNKRNNDSIAKTPVNVNEQPILPIAVNIPENKKEIEQEKILLANNEQTNKPNTATEPTNNDAIASIIGKSKTIGASTGYLSLRELATEKIKEKTLDEETLAIQKKNGRVKRFSGWDFAQIVTRGISKMTGRDVEVKPTYSDDGDVTAYALGNGIQISRGK
ncbi:MAG: hypothetical protein IPP64_16305 [Bacteroidetes bacterium]|nr:hypothetical protein [Bacteroidota bacterium]